MKHRFSRSAAGWWFVMTATVALAAAAVLVPGCRARPVDPDYLIPTRLDTRGPAPSYGELIARYNGQVADLDQVWARTDVVMRWTDEHDRAQVEQGDGNFIFRRPGELALTVGKLGQTGLWAGSDDTRYWLFDLRERQGVATVGRHENVGRPCSDRLPLPMHPQHVPHLMGLLPLAAAPDGQRPPRVTMSRGYYVVQPVGTNVRLMIDPRTYRPTRVDLLDADGDSVIVARLTDYREVSMGRPIEGDPPRIASLNNFYIPQDGSNMTLRLDVISDGRARNQVRDQAFDLDLLLAAHRPAEVIELDAPCE